MKDDEYTLESGLLEVGDGHKIYYQRWGNPKAFPTFYLHGGPGSGCKEKLKALFDPKRHQIIFHDQRGSGQSTPFGSTKNNTTQNLIEDIEKLREKFGFDKVNIIGGSWGSTLGLVYGIMHTKRVNKMILWGIFTGTKKEVDYIQQGGLRTHYPEAWNHYIEIVPESERNSTVNYYMRMIEKGSGEEQQDHIRRWVLLEGTASTIDNDYEVDRLNGLEPDESARTLALLEGHYFLNDCFLEENYIEKHASKLKSTPTVFIQGRYDHVCPPETAYAIAHTIGESCHLHMVPGSHSRGEGAMREVIKVYAWSELIS